MPEYVADKGGYLFHVQCSACHTIGNGDGIGPDLKGVTHARDRAWLSHFIRAPNELLEQKDSTATALFAKYKQLRMPNLRLRRRCRRKRDHQLSGKAERRGRCGRPRHTVVKSKKGQIGKRRRSETPTFAPYTVLLQGAGGVCISPLSQLQRRRPGSHNAKD